MYDDIRPIEGNEDKFIEYLDHLIETYDRRSNHWFVPLRKTFDRYLYWTLVFQNNNIIAFSCIQNHFFEEGTVRVMTRSWYDLNLRSDSLSSNKDNYRTPFVFMARNQMNWLRENKSDLTRAIFTFEPDRGQNLLKKISNKINVSTGWTNFIPMPDKMKTWPQATEADYQIYAEHRFK